MKSLGEDVPKVSLLPSDVTALGGRCSSSLLDSARRAFLSLVDRSLTLSRSRRRRFSPSSARWTRTRVARSSSASSWTVSVLSSALPLGRQTDFGDSFAQSPLESRSCASPTPSPTLWLVFAPQEDPHCTRVLTRHQISASRRLKTTTSVTSAPTSRLRGVEEESEAVYRASAF